MLKEATKSFLKETVTKIEICKTIWKEKTKSLWKKIESFKVLCHVDGRKKTKNAVKKGSTYENDVTTFYFKGHWVISMTSDVSTKTVKMIPYTTCYFAFLSLPQVELINISLSINVFQPKKLVYDQGYQNNKTP